MKGYLISGIQQMGIGVENVQEAWQWYIEQFGMDCRIFDDNAPAKLMLPYTGGEPRNKHAILVMNLQSGGGFEIWQHTERIPVKIKEEIRIGDLGIIACKIKARSVQESFVLFQQLNQGKKHSKDGCGVTPGLSICVLTCMAWTS